MLNPRITPIESSEIALANFPTVQVLRQLGWTLFYVLRGAVASILLAWVIMPCVAQGNIISGVAPSHQSPLEFSIAVLMWAKLLNWLAVTGNPTSLFVAKTKRVPDLGQPPPRFFRCWGFVLLTTLPVFMVSTAIMIAIRLGFRFIESKYPVVGRFKPWYYTAILLAHFDGVSGAMAVSSLSIKYLPRTASATNFAKLPSFAARFCFAWNQLQWKGAAFCIAAVYSHASLSITLSEQWQGILFAIGSYVFKIILQELSKAVVFRQHVQHVGVMAAMVGVPTILIDTQLRITLLRAKCSFTTVTGAVALAFLEILLRFATAVFVRHQIRRRHELVRSPTAALVSSASAIVFPSSTSSTDSQPSAPCSLFGRWKQRLLDFHAAEIYVDMLAGYVALGYSYAITFFYWDHPKYLLSAGRTHSLVSANQIKVLSAQFGLKIVADYVACILEHSLGINLQAMQRHRAFLSVFLMWAAVGNVVISSSMFLRD